MAKTTVYPHMKRTGPDTDIHLAQTIPYDSTPLHSISHISPTSIHVATLAHLFPAFPIALTTSQGRVSIAESERNV